MISILIICANLYDLNFSIGTAEEGNIIRQTLFTFKSSNVPIFYRIIQKIIQPFLKPKSCKKLLQFPKFPSSLCEKTFFVCFFPCYSIISSSAAYSFCTKDPCSILDKIAKTFETTSVSPCISKNKALLYILQQIDNY